MRRKLVPAALIAALAATVAVSAVAARSAAPPRNLERPFIAGTPVEGRVLTARESEWAGTRPLTYSYQWRECDGAGANCTDIAGATSKTYTLTSGNVGKRIRVNVTARNAEGSASAVSNATAVVRTTPPPPPPPPPGPPGQIKLSDGKTSIPVASVSLPQRLIVSGVAFNPNPVRSRNPFTATFRVTDTRGFVVREALVYMSGVPFGRIVQPPEAATNTEGYATFQVQPTARLPLVNGNALVVFVRARKAGEPLLAGVSTRRLVQVRLGAP